MVLAGYRNNALQEHFAYYNNADVKVVVEDRPLGTGGAIKAAWREIGGGEFVVINGDIMTDLDFFP